MDTTINAKSSLRSGGMRAYFDRSVPDVPLAVWITIAVLAVIGIGSLILSEQIATGWLALGERTNISRRDLNPIEWITIIGGVLWGAIVLRTTWGLLQRERAAWSWAQWVVLLTMSVAMVAVLSGAFDVQLVVPDDGSFLDNPFGTLELIGPALLLFLILLGTYRYLAADADYSADHAIRLRLAKTPGAGAIIGFVFLFAVFAVADDLFLTGRSQAGILATNLPRGIVAIGITFLMISGEFDLSVGSIYGASAMVFLSALTEGVFGLPPVSAIPALIIAMVFAGFLGLINGLIRIWTDIPSFIVTLGTLLAYRAIVLVTISGGRILRYADYRLPPPYIYFNRYLLAAGALLLALLVAYMGRALISAAWRALKTALNKRGENDAANDFGFFRVVFSSLRFLVTTALVVGLVVLLALAAINLVNAASGESGAILEVSFFDLANGQVDFVPRDVNLRMGTLWWALLIIIFQFVLTQTPYGNSVLAVGGNPGAALAQGVNVNRVKVTNFIICAVLAGIAGVFSVARVASVDPQAGTQLELQTIAASVIGGALLAGGYGSIFGSLLGVLVLGMIQTGLVQIGVDERMFSGVQGVIIIIAVIINTAVRSVRR
jgi:ribose/xylose/arabinose/galactoside ABC-type transport system permease subunit